MRLITPFGDIEAEPQSCLILSYGNDMASGLFIDLPDDLYAFVQADTDFYDEVAAQALAEGVYVAEVENPDWTQPPHCYVLKTLGRLVVHTAEQFLEI